MNKKRSKTFENKPDEQKTYVQELESRLNEKTAEVLSGKNALMKTRERMKILNEELNHLLEFVSTLREERQKSPESDVPGLQEFINSIEIGEDKGFLFGLNVDAKFIREKSIPTIKYLLYVSECFVKEEHELQNLKISQKKDLSIIVKTLIEYVKLSFRVKKIPLKGLVEIIHSQSLFPQDSQNITVRFFGTASIEKEVRNFIDLYSKKN